MTAPDKQELLPCPFCGNEADCDREPYPNYTIFSIWCKHCVIGVSHAETGPEVDVVKVWNTRAKPKSGEVVLSITQGQLELWVGALAVAFPSMGRRDKADAEELLTVIRSQTGGES